MNTGNTMNTDSTETKQTKRNTCCGCSSVAAVVPEDVVAKDLVTKGTKDSLTKASGASDEECRHVAVVFLCL